LRRKKSSGFICIKSERWSSVPLEQQFALHATSQVLGPGKHVLQLDDNVTKKLCSLYRRETESRQVNKHLSFYSHPLVHQDQLHHGLQVLLEPFH
jgi:hypothetical protein